MNDLRTGSHEWPGQTARRPFPIVPLLALLAGVLIATWAFLYGDQPVILDAAGYYELGQAIHARGLGGFASEVRTYGYPAFLAALMVVVGEDVTTVQSAAFVVQLALLLGGAWIGARRIAGALGWSSLEPAIFAAVAANPYLVISTVQVLTDLPGAILVYLAVALSLPQRQAESNARVAAFAIGAFCCAGLAVMVRPASLILAPVVAGIWVARARLFRDVPWFALPLGVLSFALTFAPQIWSNQRAYGVPHPLVVESLFANTLQTGLRFAKTGSLAVPGAPAALTYNNPLRPTPGVPLEELMVEEPGRLVATLVIHAFALLDHDFPFTYIRDVDPWYRWPLSTLSNLFVLGALAGLVAGIRAPPARPTDRLPRRFTSIALGAAAGAAFAVYLPMDIQTRYVLPIYPLLAAPFTIGLLHLARSARTASRSRITLGILIVAAWLGGMAAGSVWLQAQSPVLVWLRDGAPGSRAPLPREIPLAAYSTDLPKDLIAEAWTEFDVTVTNIGSDVWNVKGSHPVSVAVRFIARTTELYERVKDKMRDSQSVQLPHDVAPGRSAAVRLRIMAPPEPGRYTLVVHVTRPSVPDSHTVAERVVRVEKPR